MPEAASTLVLGTLGFAVLAVSFTPLWRLTSLLIQLVQQAGYLIAALLTGARFDSWFFFLRSRKADYLAVLRVDKGWWPSRFVTAAAGLPAPSAAGLLLARGVDRGWDATSMLVAVLVIMGGLLFFHGNWLTLLVIVAVAGIAAVFVYVAGPQAQLGAVVAFAWVLLLGGLRWNFEMSGRSHAGAKTGPGILQDLTDIPAFVWALGFVLITVGAVFAGSHWLLQA
jgi:Peptidase M50B-like